MSEYRNAVEAAMNEVGKMSPQCTAGSHRGPVSVG